MTKKRFKINDRIRRIYLQQKKGLFVKTVKKISGYDFEVNKIKFKICKICNHLNGIHLETIEFFQKVYVNYKGKNFTEGYKDNNYSARVN